MEIDLSAEQAVAADQIYQGDQDCRNDDQPVGNNRDCPDEQGGHHADPAGRNNGVIAVCQQRQIPAHKEGRDRVRQSRLGQRVQEGGSENTEVAVVVAELPLDDAAEDKFIAPWPDDDKQQEVNRVLDYVHRRREVADKGVGISGRMEQETEEGGNRREEVGDGDACRCQDDHPPE